MVSVACVGVRVSVIFHLMFVHYTFSSVATFWEGHMFSLSFVYLLFLILFHFGFERELWLLTAPVPVHCFSITFEVDDTNVLTTLFEKFARSDFFKKSASFRS